jgi:hypothetical protein
MRIATAAVLAGVLASCAGGPDPRERTRRQLDELYRPLLALVRESRASVEHFLEHVLKREYIFPTDGPMKDEELKLWLEKAEGDLMPRNDRMCALIRAKRDLAEGAELPPAWKTLLEHQDAWNAAHRKWRREGVKYNWRSPIPFPRNLERSLEMDVEKLERRL